MTRAESKMMERIHLYGELLSLDEEQAKLVLEILEEEDAEKRTALIQERCKI